MDTNVTEQQKIQFTPQVQKAIENVLQSSDPLDSADFNAIDYINQLFPTEQSLTQIETVIGKMESDITLIDDNIRQVVRQQSVSTEDGHGALNESQLIITQLFSQISEIKERAEKTEDIVKEITADIKQLDCAKKNLTQAITCLNHLHMLIEGVATLRRLSTNRQYGDILMPLEAIIEVTHHFKPYNSIAQIAELAASVDQIKKQLDEQITGDFQSTFGVSATTGKHHKLSMAQVAEACKIISILDEQSKRNILKWFITLQLEEYNQLFADNQDIAWLDKIDKRYTWLKRMLLDFEGKYPHVFPPEWELSECIAIEFCAITHRSLSRIMAIRKQEIDVKLLLYAIQKTQQFEVLLGKRFTGHQVVKLTDRSTVDPNATSDIPFYNLIGAAFIPHLLIYTDSIEKNLMEIFERFSIDMKQPFDPILNKSTIFPSCADLFVFYKKCLVQCTQLSTGQPMLDLAEIFKKYLKEYASRILESRLPKNALNVGGVGPTTGSSLSSAATGAQSITAGLRDLRENFSTAAFHNLIKDSINSTQQEVNLEYLRNELVNLCCVLTTAEYCLETIQQLEEKLKEKIIPSLVEKVDMNDEQNYYHRIISSCIQIMVRLVESVVCEIAMQRMIKMNWHQIQAVGDQSTFVSEMKRQFEALIPCIRDNLSVSRKYFTQFCLKFINVFITRYINNLYKLRPTQMVVSAAALQSSHAAITSGQLEDLQMTQNVMGCEQLLLDTHSLKVILLDMPSIGSQIKHKSPTNYTKYVISGMKRAELIIKCCMCPTRPHQQFVEQYVKLLPEATAIQEFQKLLDMKSIKRNEQQLILDIFKKQMNQSGASGNKQSQFDLSLDEDATDSNVDKGRIKKLENMIKKRLP